MTTIHDIAKRTGYSISTVSKALNGYEDISKKAKSIIIKVAEELNYYPNYSLKNIKKQDSKSIAIILSDMPEVGAIDGIMFKIMRGIFQYTSEISYDHITYTTNRCRQSEISYYQYCKHKNLDGAIVFGVSLDDPYFKELLDSSLPCVLIDISVDHLRENLGVVSVDNYKASYEAVSYLINQGHKKIACINGSKKAQVTSEREKGYRDALGDNQIEIEEEIIGYGDFIMDKSFEFAMKVLKNRKDITAFFCASDLMAIAVYEACDKLGLKIPDDVSVVGFDNIAVSEFLKPKLTTVNQDMIQIGMRAADVLRGIINNEEIVRRNILPHKLIIRDSVKAIY